MKFVESINIARVIATFAKTSRLVYARCRNRERIEHIPSMSRSNPSSLTLPKGRDFEDPPPKTSHRVWAKVSPSDLPVRETLPAPPPMLSSTITPLDWQYLMSDATCGHMRMSEPDEFLLSHSQPISKDGRGPTLISSRKEMTITSTAPDAQYSFKASWPPGEERGK